jgi:hypothetical protein
VKLIYKLNFACNSFVYCWVDKTDEKFELSPHFITEMEAESWKDRIVEILKDQLNVFDFDDWK